MVKGFFKRALNPKKGPFRLTLILSIIIGGYLGNEAANYKIGAMMGGLIS